MRATGETPHKLAQDVSGSIEMLELYLNDRMVPNASAAAAPPAAIGNVQITGLTVPDRELWLVFEATFYIAAIAVATAVKFTGGVLRNRGSGNVFSALTAPLSVPALEAGYVGAKFDRPVLMLPGNVVSAQVTGITGLPGQPISAAIWYASLGI
jgi:hypothetical protein